MVSLCVFLDRFHVEAERSHSTSGKMRALQISPSINRNRF